MELTFSYNKKYIKQALKMNSIYFIMSLMLAIMTYMASKNNANLDTINPLYIVLLPIVLYLIYFLMSNINYMEISDSNISLAIGHLLLRNKIDHKNIEKVVLVKDFEIYSFPQFFGHKTEALALHLKSGRTRYIRFQYLSEEDQNKLIEFFKQKGKLKE